LIPPVTPEKVKQLHPDQGGSEAEFIALTAADVAALQLTGGKP
jgi:hypothetical protein